jgi:hypothetical protein
MSPRANVRSLDAIRYFRPAVIRFEDDVAAALTGLRTELNRTLQWLDHDCPAYWQQQVRSGFDNVAEARTQLARRQMMTVAGRHPDCIDEKKALGRAKQHLELAQEKLRLCRQWSIKAHRAADEYNSRIGRVEQSMSQNLPRMKVILEKIVEALESYSATERPSRTDPFAVGASESAPVAEAPPAAQPIPPIEAAPPAEPAAATEPVPVAEAGPPVPPEPAAEPELQGNAPNAAVQTEPSRSRS